MEIKKVYLKCIDHTVSNEKFDLLYNNKLDMLETFPKPNEKDLPKYYESQAYISHTDSKKTIIEKLYQTVKYYTLKAKLKLINKLKTEDKFILDIGCGTGDFLTTCSKNNWIVFGVEPNSKAREITQKKIGESCVVVSDISELPNQKYDVISLWHVLEHVYNVEEYILQIKSLLKPKGYIIVAVPNFKSYDANYYKEFWAAYDTPRHLWHFSKKAIKLIFKSHQLNVIKIFPMFFDSFYISLLSEKYKNGKTNFLSAFFVGLLSNLKALRSKEYSSQIFIIKKQ